MQAKKQKKNPTKTMTYNLFSLYVTMTYKVDDTERGGALCVRGSPPPPFSHRYQLTLFIDRTECLPECPYLQSGAERILRFLNGC